MAYFCLNGEFKKESEPGFFADNRAFRYGEALVENIHAFATDLQFTELHLKRLMSGMEFIEMEVPAFLNVANLKQLAASLLNRNKIFGGALIRLTVFGNNINANSNQSISFLLESKRLEHDRYALNDKGLTAGISEKYQKQTTNFSAIHRANAYLYLLTEKECRKRSIDTLILLNEHGRMVEAHNSNLFLVKGQTLFTPGIQQGCIPGVMREVVLNIAVAHNLRINEQSSLTPAALSDADEVFITNAVEGIRWIGAWEQIRYFNKTARFLCSKLNEYAFRT